MNLVMIETFLTQKFPEGTPGYILIWSRQTKKTKYFATSDQKALLAYVAKHAEIDDLYTAIGTQKEPLGPNARGAAQTVLAVTGLGADIDVRAFKETSKRYPETFEEALRVLSEFSEAPTLVVNSGNGLHAHWLFDAPIVIDTNAKREAVTAVIRAHQRRLQDHYKKAGFVIDNVGDLARLLRIPGTLNHKSEPPKPVTLLEASSDRRYAFSEFEATATAEEKPKRRDDKRRRKQKYAPALHAAIVAGCAWYRGVVEDAASCDEPNWYAGASIAVRCADGERIFHEYSKTHPGYSEREAGLKLTRALKEAGPRTCASIEADLGFEGCAACPHYGQITSPIQLGQMKRAYDPGERGPVPLGYTKSGLYAFLCPVRKIIIQANAQQLLSGQFLRGLAPSEFWSKQYPNPKGPGFSFNAAGEALIEAATDAGPFNPRSVRGRGIWREGEQIIMNLGGAIPQDAKNLYLCFERIEFDISGPFDVQRLLDLLQKFRWRDPNDAMLLLGWLAIAPICGVLNWRPHCWVWGPARCGKTTIHAVSKQILQPLVISVDGQSSEAGIRQTIGPDSLPVVIDEFEADQHSSHLRGIIRLARSASSADNPVVRGTPEGKALQFSLRTSFFFLAINPAGMSIADESRVIMLELMMHDGDEDTARFIQQEEAYFRSLGNAWCGHMVALAPHIPTAVDAFELAITGTDRRHRQNMGTLLAGAFVALNGRAPTPDEAAIMAEEYMPTIEAHAEALDRDDAMECLHHLFSHVVDRYSLGHWLGIVKEGPADNMQLHDHDARRIIRSYDMAIMECEGAMRFVIRNRAPNVERIFANTPQWMGSGWMKALRKIEGARSPKNPVRFEGGEKDRCIALPLSLVPKHGDRPIERDSE